jgi:hypothetical protein
MAQRVYATAGDYEDLAEEPFENPGEQNVRLNKRLRSASIEIEGLTRFAVFDTDDDGYPTDADVADALKEATCAIVEHWEDTGDPRGVEAAQGAVKILSVSLGTTSSGDSKESPRDKLAARIGDKAVTILSNAGLLSGSVSY